MVRNYEKTVNQLEELKIHCQAMTEIEFAGEIWSEDIKALDEAIAIIKELKNVKEQQSR
jgi:hypothetical protein|nr:MAG TPA: hypothetical protein [Caudoviricetes sp.]